MTATFEQYQKLLDHAPCGIGLLPLSQGLRVAYFNKTYFDIIGYTREEYDRIAGDPIDVLVYQEDRSRIHSSWDGSPSAPETMEYRIVTKTGSLVWVKVNSSIVELDGEPYSFISFVDISKEKKQELTAAARKDALRIVDQSLSAGTIINSLGFNSPLLYISDNFESFLGYTKEEFREMYSRQYVDVIHPEDFARVLEINERNAVNRPKTYEMQFRFIRKDGSVFWTLEKGTFIENYLGEPAYLSVFIDISEQKRAEKSLFERNAMFDVLLDNSNLSMWTYDIKTHTAVLVSSKRHQRPILPTGTPNYPESVIATGFINEKSVEDMRTMLHRVDSGIKTVSAEIWYVPQTEDPWCDKVTYVNIFDGEGNVLRTIGIAEDITDQKLAQRKYEEELNYQKNMQYDSLLSSARCNITKGTVEAVYSAENRMILHTDTPYAEGLHILIATGYEESDRELIAEKASLAHIEKEFDRGVTQISFDYRRRALSGKVLWVNTTLKLYREAQTGDLKLFLYTTDINKEKTNELIITPMKCHHWHEHPCRPEHERPRGGERIFVQGWNFGALSAYAYKRYSGHEPH